MLFRSAELRSGIRKVGGWVAAAQVWMHFMPPNCTLKMAKIVNFTLHIFWHNKISAPPSPRKMPSQSKFCQEGRRERGCWKYSCHISMADTHTQGDSHRLQGCLGSSVHGLGCPDRSGMVGGILGRGAWGHLLALLYPS